MGFMTELHCFFKKFALYLSFNVFSMKVLIGDTIFMSPTRGGYAIFRGHPSYAKVQPPPVQREYLHFLVILRPWVMVRPQESNPRLSCVVHGPIYGRFMGFYVNGFLSIKPFT